jgi:hypothetical protein
MVDKTDSLHVFIFQMESHCFAEVLSHLVERFALGDDREFQALGDVYAVV